MLVQGPAPPKSLAFSTRCAARRSAPSLTSLAFSTRCAARRSAPCLTSLAFSTRGAARRSALSLHIASLSSQLRSCPRSLAQLAAPLGASLCRPAIRWCSTCDGPLPLIGRLALSVCTRVALAFSSHAVCARQPVNNVGKDNSVSLCIYCAYKSTP